MLTASRLIKGRRPDAPLLVPLASPGENLSKLVRFCRIISPGAPILVPLSGFERQDNSLNGSQDHLVDRIGEVIATAGPIHDLPLVPVVVVGHGEGADWAAHVALLHGARLAACILLRPTRCPAAGAQRRLDGVFVLLCLSRGVRSGAQIRNVLSAAGAEIISEQVISRRSPGGHDAAICRVFLSSLFGPPRPPP
jgi:pimeloyl-ACP methyl ester carboxylesterase